MVETLNNNIDPPIYVFSGGKGLPANSLIRSVLVQYPENKIPVKIIPGIWPGHQYQPTCFSPEKEAFRFWIC